MMTAGWKKKGAFQLCAGAQIRANPTPPLICKLSFVQVFITMTTNVVIIIVIGIINTIVIVIAIIIAII